MSRQGEAAEAAELRVSEALSEAFAAWRRVERGQREAPVIVPVRVPIRLAR